MTSSSFARTATLLLSILSSASAQATAGASYIQGGGASGSAPYRLVDDYNAQSFFDKFIFYSSYDPTYGHVQYVNKSVAIQNGYASTTNQGTARIQPDLTGIWPTGGLGRPSVRIISSNTYLHGLFLFDLNHMPTGCGSWPAYWLLGPEWPYTGEVDIIEGINTSENNTVSLHTSPGCSIAGSGQTAQLETNNCDSNLNGNSGCGSTFLNTTSPINNYGQPFNDNGGGVYATEWTSDYIKTWFFPRQSIPSSIISGAPNVAEFGTPAVNMQGACDIDSHFQNMSVIVNIDFCGAWAGNVYSQWPNCPQNATRSRSLDSCTDAVGTNLTVVQEAYFDINYLRVYQMPASVATTSSYSTTLTSVEPEATSTNSVPKGQGTTLETTSSATYSGPLSSTLTSSALPTATATSCPGFNGTIYTDANNQPYAIYCDFDYQGPAPLVQPTSSFETCMELCDRTAGCWAVSYYDNFCYIKSPGWDLNPAPGVNAAIRQNGVAPTGFSSSPGQVSPQSTQPTSSSPSSSTVASLSSSLGASSSGMVTSSAASSSTFSSSTSSVGSSPSPSMSTVPAASASCPQNDGAYIRDDCGVTYIMSCGNDTLYGSTSAVQVADLNACFEACSSGANGECTAFTYDTRPVPPVCYIKGYANEGFGYPNTALVAAVQIDYYGTDTPVPSSTTRVCTVPPSATSSFLSSTTATTQVTDTAANFIEVSSSPSSSVFGGESSTSVGVASSMPSGATSWSTSAAFSSMMSSDSPSSTIMSSATSSATSMSSIGPSVANSSSSATTPSSSATSTSASTAAPPCPSSTADLCSGDSKVCSSEGGTSYNVTCGIVYRGNAIPEDDIVYPPATTQGARRSDNFLQRRVTEPNFGSCQVLCDYNDACVAVNYIGTNCTLLSSVTGQYNASGAVTAVQVPDNEPVCPGSNGTTYSTNSTQYSLTCYGDYAGGDMGSPIYEAVFSDCLPHCDSVSGCMGVVYDTSTRECYLKSSLSGAQSSNSSRLVAVRTTAVPAASQTITRTVNRRCTASTPSGTGTTVVFTTYTVTPL